MDNDFSDDFIVKGKFSMKNASTKYKGKLKKSDGKAILKEEEELQQSV